MTDAELEAWFAKAIHPGNDWTDPQTAARRIIAALDRAGKLEAVRQAMAGDMLSDEELDRRAQAAYAASCAVMAEEPEWGRGGFKTQITYWRAIARAVTILPPIPSDGEEA